MKGFLKGVTIMCALGFLVFGASLDSMEHFEVIFKGMVICAAWCIGYVLWTQRREE